MLRSLAASAAALAATCDDRANHLVGQYDQRGDLSALQQAILLARYFVALTPQDSPERGDREAAAYHRQVMEESLDKSPRTKYHHAIETLKADLAKYEDETRSGMLRRLYWAKQAGLPLSPSYWAPVILIGAPLTARD